MSRKSTLPTHNIVSSQAVSSTISAPIINVQNIDKAIIQVQWASGVVPSITCVVSARLKDEQGTNKNGPWQVLDFGSTISLSGASGNHSLEIETLAYSELKLDFVVVSGSVVLDVFVRGYVRGA